MPLTEIPFGLAGKIFRSPMPFGTYDPAGDVYREFKQNNISVIVLLASESECIEKASMNLPDRYKKDGFLVIHLPISDFSVPSKDALEYALSNIVNVLVFL